MTTSNDNIEANINTSDSGPTFHSAENISKSTEPTSNIVDNNVCDTMTQNLQNISKSSESTSNVVNNNICDTTTQTSNFAVSVVVPQKIPITAQKQQLNHVSVSMLYRELGPYMSLLSGRCHREHENWYRDDLRRRRLGHVNSARECTILTQGEERIVTGIQQNRQHGVGALPVILSRSSSTDSGERCDDEMLPMNHNVGINVNNDTKLPYRVKKSTDKPSPTNGKHLIDEQSDIQSKLPYRVQKLGSKVEKAHEKPSEFINTSKTLSMPIPRIHRSTTFVGLHSSVPTVSKMKCKAECQDCGDLGLCVVGKSAGETKHAPFPFLKSVTNLTRNNLTSDCKTQQEHTECQTSEADFIKTDEKYWKNITKGVDSDRTHTNTNISGRGLVLHHNMLISRGLKIGIENNNSEHSSNVMSNEDGKLYNGTSKYVSDMNSDSFRCISKTKTDNNVAQKELVIDRGTKDRHFTSNSELGPNNSVIGSMDSETKNESSSDVMHRADWMAAVDAKIYASESTSDINKSDVNKLYKNRLDSNRLDANRSKINRSDSSQLDMNKSGPNRLGSHRGSSENATHEGTINVTTGTRVTGEESETCVSNGKVDGLDRIPGGMDRMSGGTDSRADKSINDMSDVGTYKSDDRTDGWTDVLTDAWTDGRTDGWTDGRTDGWTDGRTDGWTDGDDMEDNWTDVEVCEAYDVVNHVGDESKLAINVFLPNLCR